MKSLVFLIILSIPVLSWSQVRTVEFEVSHTVGNTDIPMVAADIEFEVIETGDAENPINWDATLGLMQSSRDTHRGILIESTPEYTVSNPVNGNAVFATVGIQGRKFIVKDLIEGMVRADYGFRVHDNDESYKDFYGQPFNDYGGLNLSAGASVIAARKYAIGGMVTRNMSSGTTTVRMTLGWKFSMRRE